MIFGFERIKDTQIKHRNTFTFPLTHIQFFEVQKRQKGKKTKKK